MEKPYFNLIIAGTRDFDDYRLLKRKLDIALETKKETHIVQIVCGMASGADLLGKKYAEENDYSVIECPADWDLHGKKAGYLRNSEMADIADASIIFWNGISKGSKHMIDLSKKKELPTKVIRYDKEPIEVEAYSKNEDLYNLIYILKAKVRDAEKNAEKRAYKKFEEELDDYKDDISVLEEKIWSHESFIRELEENIEVLENQRNFPEIDGNDNLKKDLLSKAYHKFTLEELEQKLGIDWI